MKILELVVVWWAFALLAYKTMGHLMALISPVWYMKVKLQSKAKECKEKSLLLTKLVRLKMYWVAMRILSFTGLVIVGLLTFTMFHIAMGV